MEKMEPVLESMPNNRFVSIYFSWRRFFFGEMTASFDEARNVL